MVNGSRLPLSDDVRFSIAFAPAEKRAMLSTLLAYEARLAAITTRGEELHVPLIKLAWWRDSVAKLGTKPIIGEPLLEALRSSIDRMAYPDLAAMAEAHMDRLERGDHSAPARALLSAGATLMDHPLDWVATKPVPMVLRPISATIAVRPLAGRPPTRRHLRIISHMLTGRLPMEVLQ